jgi:hypothetical protein
MNFKCWLENDLLAMSPIEQAKADIRLHQGAIKDNRFGLSGSRMLYNDAKFKQQFIDLLESPQKDPQKAQELMKKIKKDQQIHQNYLKLPESEKTGSHLWHQTWIKIYKKWIEVLEKIIFNT